jgi:NAD(P)-dependent dehydrogenase (short-subunit alcohol dehydrogenase family)
MGRLEGQVGLVTGGGRGIGAGVVRELAAAGMRVALSGRTGEQVEAIAREVGGLALVGDVSERETVERWVAATERQLGPLDLLVNNAAVTGAPEPFWEHEPGAWWHVFEVNLRGPFLCCHAALPGMIARRRGRIVNVTSGAAYLPTLPASVQDTSYPASKAGLTRFSELLAAELAGHGVTVFAVAPGLVRTEMTATLPGSSPWTPPEAAPRLVRLIAEGAADALSGRYLHAEHDADLAALAARADEIRADDLNAIRLRR